LGSGKQAITARQKRAKRRGKAKKTWFGGGTAAPWTQHEVKKKRAQKKITGRKQIKQKSRTHGLRTFSEWAGEKRKFSGRVTRGSRQKPGGKAGNTRPQKIVKAESLAQVHKESKRNLEKIGCIEPGSKARMAT